MDGVRGSDVAACAGLPGGTAIAIDSETASSDDGIRDEIRMSGIGRGSGSEANGNDRYAGRASGRARRGPAGGNGCHCNGGALL
ncbi:hypothetical protein BGC_56700 [Burkholderia sp. 3C]